MTLPAEMRREAKRLADLGGNISGLQTELPETFANHRQLLPVKTHQLRADSSESALQWVKQLQKIIFKTRNQGNNVKVRSLPSSFSTNVDLYPHRKCS